MVIFVIFFLEFGSAGFLKVEKQIQKIIKNRCWASVWSFLGLNLMYAMSKLDINFVCNPPRYTVGSKIPPSVGSQPLRKNRTGMAPEKKTTLSFAWVGLPGMYRQAT